MRMTTGVVLLVLLAGCGGNGQAGERPSRPETFTAGGILTLVDSDIFRAAGRCEGGPDSGYGDMSEGAVVIVRNTQGQQVGLGELALGRVEDSVTCVFSFEVPDIPDEGERFTVEVAERGQVPFMREDAADLSLSLG